eukprot:gb/GEZN01005197.1/.p1 GENE.gb/GEZN01005197.1/~~gb/GEZN01005197.1/.p1  ORF type:complete len:375 (-),score=27.81 gb/GEZN01005197.1/:713-1723(-)
MILPLVSIVSIPLISFLYKYGAFNRSHLPIKYGYPKADSPPSIPERVPVEDHGRFMISYDDRLWMFSRSWEPSDHIEVKATLLIVHGTVDHSGVYNQIGRFLADHGIAVFAMDMRGWGLSDGEPMYFHSMDVFVSDIDAFYKHIHVQPRYAPIKSRFLLGKSIGGLITAYAAANNPTNFSGLLGLSGAYQIGPKFGMPPAPVVYLMKQLNYCVPKLPIKKLFDPKLIVSDDAALAEWKADPLCSKQKLTLAYTVEILLGASTLPEKVPKISIPMLMMVGSADQVVTLGGHHRMMDLGSHDDKTLKIYEGGYHNLLAEPHLKQTVMDDIRDWILNHV